VQLKEKKKKKNCIKIAPAASAFVRLEKHRIANEPTASPFVRLEKKNPIANAIAAYLQVKEKKKKNRMIPRTPLAYSKVELKNNKDNSCNRTFSRGAAKTKLKRDKHS
jgi:hypothetical protein